MTSEEKYSLIKIISYDIVQNSMVQLLLLIVITLSAITIVTISYKTRLLIAQKDIMIEENELLDIEWRKLILEENSLANRSRIEHLAIERLNMIHVDPAQEYIVLIKLAAK